MHTKPVTPSSFAETTVEKPIEPSRGTLIDRFLVLEQLGAGGMGVVYAAHDPELDRKVALKLLLPRVGAAGYGDQTRLLREAQALAKLSHPNVVAVHDVGTRGDRVWIAMEFVSGQTLTAWARERPRRWPELLAVLADVARGMAAAHEAGLVHRDIKPDNVMIGQDGRVRVMDFGLAHGRATGSTEPDLTATLESGHLTAPLALRLTAQGAVQGTPAYMAPEQWLGHDEEPATDQFGWSVMAWELLYGERPFAGATNISIATTVLAGQRRPPPRGRSVPSWLRRVLERGLATDPTKRWPSMAALLAAFDRGKTRARVRLAATALAGIAAIAASTEAYRRWDVAQRVATCEAAGAVIDQTWNDDARQRLRDAFQATGVSYAATSAEKTIPWLDKQANEWKHAHTEVCLNSSVHQIWNEDLVDRATWCLEDRQMEFESLVSLLTGASATSVQRAINAAAGLKATRPCADENTLARRPIPPAQSRHAIRKIRKTVEQSELALREGRLRESLSLARRARENAEETSWPPLVAETRALQGYALRRMGAYEEAKTAFTDAYFEAALSASWDVATRSASEAIYTIGYKLARFDEGLAWAKHARVALLNSRDTTGTLERHILSHLATVSISSGSYFAAQNQLEQAIALERQILPSNHPDAAINISNLAVAYRLSGAYKKASELHEHALAIRESTLGPGHPDTASSLSNLALVHHDLGDYTRARTFGERALSIREYALEPEHPDVALSLNNVAITYNALGRYAEAQKLLEHALVLQERSIGSKHPDFALTLSNLATTYHRRENYADALDRGNQALIIRKNTAAPNHPDIAWTLNTLAEIYIATRSLDEAQASLLRALDIWNQTPGLEGIETAYTLSALADIYLLRDLPNEAISLLEHAIYIYNAHDATQPGEALAHFNLAKALARSGHDISYAIQAAVDAQAMFHEASATTETNDVDQWINANSVIYSTERDIACYDCASSPAFLCRIE